MNTNLVKAVQKASGREQTGEINDGDLLEIHRFITGIRYVEPIEPAISEPGAETATTAPHFTNNGQPV